MGSKGRNGSKVRNVAGSGNSGSENFGKRLVPRNVAGFGRRLLVPTKRLNIIRLVK
jgi:hypothetical protein